MQSSDVVLLSPHPIHDALPIFAPYASALAAMLTPQQSVKNLRRLAVVGLEGEYGYFDAVDYTNRGQGAGSGLADIGHPRSEEHMSELQSPCNLVCRLLLEKK